MMKTDQNKTYWLDRPENITRLFRILLVVCILLFLPDVMDLMGIVYHKHIVYSAEGWMGFYALFGFIAYSFIVLAGWIWRWTVRREEDYYDC
tara:strand:- start:21 stop:296 length:276 start_codon:yes stop_codon:yes gene_type:complete